MAKLRIGMVGTMTTNFRGNKEAQYAAATAKLQGLAPQLGFEFFPVVQGIYSSQDAEGAVKECLANKIDFLLIQTSSFSAGSHIQQLVEAAPYLGLWAVPEGSQKDGSLPLNSFCAMNMYGSIIKNYLKHRNLSFKWFYGSADDRMFQEPFAVTVKALGAVVNMKQSKVALVGGVAPGFDNLYYDERLIEQKTGVKVLRQLEFLDIKNRAQGYSAREMEAVRGELLAQSCGIENSVAGSMDNAARVYRALREIAEEEGVGALALSCWPKFQTEMNFAVCSVVGSLNAAGLPVACEGDVFSATSMLALKYLSGQTTTLMDLVDFDLDAQQALLWHCGPSPHCLADEAGMNLAALSLMDQDLADGRVQRTGLISDLVLKPGRATIAAFANDFDNYMVIEGDFDNTRPSYTGSRGWIGNLRLNGEPISVVDFISTIMASGFQHHYPLVYGEHIHAWIEMCSWLGIAPIQKVPHKPYLQGAPK